MIELIFVLLVCAVAYRIAFPAGKAPAFVSQAATASLAYSPADKKDPVPEQVTTTDDRTRLAAIRKQLAADEKLTPELKSAFDLIQAALEAK